MGCCCGHAAVKRRAQRRGAGPTVVLARSPQQVGRGDRLQRIAALVEAGLLAGRQHRLDPAGDVVGLDHHGPRPERYPHRRGGRGDRQAHRPLEHVQHPRVALQPGQLVAVGAGHLDPRHAQVGDHPLLHVALAQRRQHLGDVVEERRVRSDDQHALAQQPPTVLEQQVRGTVQAHRGLAGARAALDDEALVATGADHHVLLGLDRGDDLAHRAGAGGADLGEDRVGHAGGDVGGGRVGEVLVEVRRQLPLAHREPAAVGEPEGVVHGRPVERRRDRCPPVDDHRLVVVVLDVPAADVPAVGRLARAGRILLDAPEEVAGAGRAQIVEGIRAP